MPLCHVHPVSYQRRRRRQQQWVSISRWQRLALHPTCWCVNFVYFIRVYVHVLKQIHFFSMFDCVVGSISGGSLTTQFPRAFSCFVFWFWTQTHTHIPPMAVEQQCLTAFIFVFSPDDRGSLNLGQATQRRRRKQTVEIAATAASSVSRCCCFVRRLNLRKRKKDQDDLKY